MNEKDAFLSTASLVIGDGVTQDGQEVGMMIAEKESLSISPPPRLYRRICWKINLMSSPELEQEFPQHLQITTRRIDSRMVPPAISVGTGDGSSRAGKSRYETWTPPTKVLFPARSPIGCILHHTVERKRQAVSGCM